jgi:uncharacterized protein YdeI (YjbR/CyaY-like superfamily)
MARPQRVGPLLHVTTRRQWRAWLKKHYKSMREVWLVYAKKHTGRARVSYNDAVEEALCFGWIDSTVRSIDDDRFAQRFSVRKPKSAYSAANLTRLRALVALGAVMRDVLPTLPDLRPKKLTIPRDVRDALKANPTAWKHFRAMSDSYLRIRIAYIVGARRRPAEFRKRLANFVKMTEKNRLIGFGGINRHY